MNRLIKNLYLFKYVPFGILSKYWVRFYTVESDFYKVLNNNLMKLNLSFNFKTFIKMLYLGIETNSLESYPGKYLYRGSSLNRIEIEKIKKYQNLGKLSTIVVFSKAFLSFSEDEKKARKFCGKTNETKVGCLYILENKNINSHESNADIQKYSVFPEEKEILFFPGSSFIIKNIKDNNNKIEIILNYNGKFKEKYSFIYEECDKINNLIRTNVLTKNIAGKELSFVKGGRYLIGERMNPNDLIGIYRIYKGKDLKADEIVVIKQFKKGGIFENAKAFYDEVNILKKISEKIKYTVKCKDYFETKDYYYIILDYYDDSLEEFLKKCPKESNLSPNLINKIFNQLNMTFKELLNNQIVHRNIRPETILIKYLNEDKTNFNSILTGYEQ